MRPVRPFSGRILFALLLSGAALAVPHVLLRLTWRGRGLFHEELRTAFFLSNEQGLLTWLTVCVVFSLGVTCAALAVTRRQRAWWGPAALFAYLSMDDQVMLHERIGWMADAAVDAAGGRGIYAWLVVLGPLYALLGLFSAAWMLRSCGADRAARTWIVLGLACLAVALGLEACEEPFLASGLSWRGLPACEYSQLVEELLELFGPALLLSALVRLLEADRAARLERPSWDARALRLESGAHSARPRGRRANPPEVSSTQ